MTAVISTALNTTEVVLLVICGVLVLADFIIFAVNVVFLWRHHAVTQIKTAVVTATWLVGLSPVRDKEEYTHSSTFYTLSLSIVTSLVFL